MIYDTIRNLTHYGLNTGLIAEADLIYVRNQLLDLLGLDNFPEELATPPADPGELEPLLAELLDYAAAKGLLGDNTITTRDLFDTRIMGLLTPRPSQVIGKFQELYRQSPRAATDYFYKLSQDSDYIRRYRIKKDLKWQTDTAYGPLDITINLAKPEKDPQEIAAARQSHAGGYPKCLLCKENVGYAGHPGHPARQNHRIIPLHIRDSRWGFQYSPYVYYQEHCIVFHSEHIPMKIERATFAKLLDFVVQFPHYFVGSNADLPIVGGSILTHDHFQGGNYQFPMARAPLEEEFTIPGYEDISGGIVKWPMSVLRLSSPNPQRLTKLGGHILAAWRSYSDEEAFILAATDGEPHNTITPIARKRGDRYELDLVLRNNITTSEHPFGVYHPHEELHHIKKENIGLIEVMGLAVLPARLKREMELLADCLVNGRDYTAEAQLTKHLAWIKEFLPAYPLIDQTNVWTILHREIGTAFLKVLEHAGVYKATADGRKFFRRFIQSL